MQWTGVGSPTNKLNKCLILCSEQIGNFYTAAREGICEKESHLLVAIWTARGHAGGNIDDLAILCKKASDLSSQAGSDWWLLYKVYRVSTSVTVLCAVVVIVRILSAFVAKRVLFGCTGFPAQYACELGPNCSAFNLTDESVSSLMHKRI